MTSLVVTGGDVEDVNSKPLRDRSRFLEFTRYNQESSGAQQAEAEPSPRLLKSHLHEHILSKSMMQGKPRVVVVMRNPKDALVSFYEGHKHAPFCYTGSWDEFFEMYRKKELFYGDIFDMNAGWWKRHRHDENFLFLKFEDMKRDPRLAVEQLAQHCHVALTSEQIDRIVTNVDFNVMRSCNAIRSSVKALGIPVNDFLRKGVVGDWRNYFTTEQSAYVDAEIAKRFDPIGLNFSCK